MAVVGRRRESNLAADNMVFVLCGVVLCQRRLSGALVTVIPEDIHGYKYVHYSYGDACHSLDCLIDFDILLDMHSFEIYMNVFLNLLTMYCYIR